MAALLSLALGCSSKEEPVQEAETSAVDGREPVVKPAAKPVGEPWVRVEPASAVAASNAQLPGEPKPSGEQPSSVLPKPSSAPQSEPALALPPRLLPLEPPAAPSPPKVESPKIESPKIESPKAEPPKAEPPKADSAPAASTRRNPLRDGSDRPDDLVPQKIAPPRQPPAKPATEPVAAKSAAKPEAGPSIRNNPAPHAPVGKTEISIQPDSKGKGVESKVAAGAASALPGTVPQTAKHSGLAFDPIKENGPIFVDWPKPKVALVITGRQDGYLEPCGCAGLDRMKGGMSRRYTMFQTLRAQGWPVVGLDVGGIAKGFGRQAELKFQITVEGMRKMGYSAITLGTVDLQLPAEEVLAATAPVNNQPSPFLSANVGLFVFDEATLAQSRVIVAGDKRLGVTAVLGKAYQKRINNESVKMLDPEAALAKIVPLLKQKADYLILLAHASKEESIELGRKFPQFDLVVTAGGPAEPPAQAEEIRKGGTRLIEVGEKGMYAVVLGMFDDPRQPLRYQRVTLDSRFATSRDMRALMAAYQDQLRTLGLAGLGIRALPHPHKDVNGQFVGNEKCKSCHEESYKVWKKSGHSRAYASLIQADPPRNFDPECVSCHVIGWHPTKFFPYQSGYMDLEKTPKLINVGCEDCHGPGETHVAAEMGADKAAQDKARKAILITKAEAADPTSKRANCFSCHDGDNSPEFKFETYWPHVEHHEKE